MPGWARSTAQSMNWFLSTGLAGHPHFNAVELGKHGRNRTNVWGLRVRQHRGRKSARRPQTPSNGQADSTCRRCDPGCDPARRSSSWISSLDQAPHSSHRRRTGRRFRGVEIDPAYVDVAIDRWEAMTGGTARARREGPGMSKVGPGRRPKSTGFPERGKRQSRRQAQEGTPGRLDFRFRCGHRQDIDDRAGRQVPPRSRSEEGALVQDLSERDRWRSLGPSAKF